MSHSTTVTCPSVNRCRFRRHRWKSFAVDIASIVPGNYCRPPVASCAAVRPRRKFSRTTIIASRTCTDCSSYSVITATLVQSTAGFNLHVHRHLQLSQYISLTHTLNARRLYMATSADFTGTTQCNGLMKSSLSLSHA